MSVVTMQQAPMKVSGQVAFAFSQSGQSPDLVNSLRLLRKRGALSVSMVNAEGSPLEAACEFSLPLSAGTESSVAATKSFIATLSASARLIAHWKEDSELLEAGRIARRPAQAARVRIGARPSKPCAIVSA
jgi:glucosamine--fructose-6-phosphate aminotransferase (isomerizing)